MLDLTDGDAMLVLIGQAMDLAANFAQMFACFIAKKFQEFG